MLSEPEAQLLILNIVYPENKIKCPYCLQIISAKRGLNGYFECSDCRSKYRKEGTSPYRFNEWTGTRLQGNHLKAEVIIKLIQAFLGNTSPKNIMIELEEANLKLGKSAIYRFLDNLVGAILATFPEREYQATKEESHKFKVFGVEHFGNEVKISALPELSSFKAEKIIYKANELGKIDPIYEKFLGLIIGKNPFVPFLNEHGHSFKTKSCEEFYKFYEAFQENDYFLNMQSKRLYERMKVIEYVYNYSKKAQTKTATDVCTHFLKLLLMKQK